MIPYEINKTLNNIQFLLFDSGIDDEKRILIVLTKPNCIHLFNNKVWIVDCTFEVAPPDWEQLVSIQAKIRKKYNPLVYCLMKKK